MLALLMSSLLNAEPKEILLEKVTNRTIAVNEFVQNSKVLIELAANELNSNGQILHSKVNKLSMTQKNGYAVFKEVLFTSEDGKEVTSNKKSSDGKNEGKSELTSFLSMVPFQKTPKASYCFSILSPPKDVNLVRIGFQPCGEKEPILMVGEATVDPATGDIISLFMHPSKLPAFVDHLAIDMDFSALTPAGRALSKVSVKGDGGFAFMHKYFRVVTTMRDYEKTE